MDSVIPRVSGTGILPSLAERKGKKKGKAVLAVPQHDQCSHECLNLPLLLSGAADTWEKRLLLGSSIPTS